jgi:hypothetical protein
MKNKAKITIFDFKEKNNNLSLFCKIQRESNNNIIYLNYKMSIYKKSFGRQINKRFFGICLVKEI